MSTDKTCPMCLKVHKVSTSTDNPRQLCDDCKRKIEESAKIYCEKCGAIVAMMAPGAAPDGFVYESQHRYHVPYCKSCSPDKAIGNVDILEHMEYRRKKGGKVQ